MLLFWIKLLEPKLASVIPYLTNHQEMTTVHPSLPNTRHSHIYIYLFIYLFIYYMIVAYSCSFYQILADP